MALTVPSFIRVFIEYPSRQAIMVSAVLPLGDLWGWLPTMLLVGLSIWMCYIKYTRSQRARWLIKELDDEDRVCVVSTPLTRELAYEFKAEFGELRYNKANRILAGDWVRLRLAKIPDLRAVDRVKHMDIAIELCLLPTKHAVAASKLARSREVRARRGAVDSAK